ncbi:MAG: hypothetical protein WBE76_28195 [Terracidiphilus sp.]
MPKLEPARRRPLGVKLLATYFLLKAIAIACAAVLGLARPELRARAIDFISYFYRELKDFDLERVGIALSPVFVALEVVKAAGVWLLRKWAWIFIVLWLTWWVCEAGAAVLILWATDRGTLLSIVATPEFAFAVLLNVVVLAYLLDPDVKSAFGTSNEEIL